MSKIRRSIYNGSSMIKISDMPRELVIEYTRQLFDLKRSRTKLVEEVRMLRKSMYNISTKMNEIEKKIEEQLFKIEVKV